MLTACRQALCAALVLIPAPLTAHPHIFVEAQVVIEVSEAGQVTGVRLAWTYDDLFSLLLTSDLGIDMDGDGELTAEEYAALEEAVLTWPADFSGDLFLSSGGAELTLGPPEEMAMTYDLGRVEERHLRPVLDPPPPGEVVEIRVYDPFYYVAYTIVGDLVIEGREDCEATWQGADLNAAYSLVDELLYGRPASEVGPEEDFPMVGEAFADTVRVSCPALG